MPWYQKPSVRIPFSLHSAWYPQDLHLCLVRAVGIKEYIAGLSLMSNSCNLSWLYTTTFPTPEHHSTFQQQILVDIPSTCPVPCVGAPIQELFHKFSQSSSPFWVLYSEKAFSGPRKENKKGNSSGCRVLSGRGRREQGCKVLLASRIWEENPSKQPLKPCLSFFFFSEQLSGSSGFYVFLSRWEFSPASSTGTLGFREAFESREVAQPVFRLIDFCGWLKCWRDHSGLLQKCMKMHELS